ncbi:methyltransferase domain-containing protein [bacterium]|nr:methyltransferase domain-containing protein [bacterium]
MPFRPLPKIFTDHLATLDPRRDPVVELGSGDGAFAALLEPYGVRPFGLDRGAPWSGTCDIVGDARRAPLRPGTLAVVAAPNLVRHLVPRRGLGPWVAEWRRLLKPGGRLYVFEDAPDVRVPAQRHFRDVQDFLAQLAPTARGPLLGRERFLDLTAAAVPRQAWQTGYCPNEATIDAGEVMRMLGSGRGGAGGPVAALIRGIGRDGIAPGRCWWAMCEAEEQG